MRRRSAIRRRTQLWRRILHEHRFPTRATKAAALLSAAVDIGRQAVPQLASPAPLGLAPMEIRGADGSRFRVRAFSDDIYLLLPGREEDVHDAILEPLRQGDVFVDVGANVGYYTVSAARRVGPTGSVVAIEGWSPTARALRRNLALNGLDRVQVVEAAVVADSESESVGFRRQRGASGLGQVERSSAATARVPATTLDAVCGSLDRVRMMKLDIEGGELDALAGGGDTLAKTEIVVVECAQPEQIRQLLSEAGFVVSPLKFTSHLIGRRP